MKKILIVFLFICNFAFSQRDSLVDVYDGGHNLIKIDVHVNDLLDVMEEELEDIYYIREYKQDGTITECLYVRRKIYWFLTI